MSTSNPNTNTEIENTVNTKMNNMKCFPIDDNDNEITEVYQVGLKEANLLASQNISLTIVNFFLFFLAILLAIILVPFFYKNVIWNFVKNRFKNEESRKGILSAIDITLSLVFLAVCVFSLTLGTGKIVDDKTYIEFYIALYAVIFIFISIVIIRLYKRFIPSEYDFEKTDGKSYIDQITEAFPKLLGWFFNFIKTNWKILLYIIVELFIISQVIIIALFFTGINIPLTVVVSSPFAIFTVFSIAVCIVVFFTNKKSTPSIE